MSLSELVLFYSTSSRASQVCHDIVMRSELKDNVKLVCLDSVEARKAAKEGKHFQIVNVPTLVITFEDGNLQLLVGTEKIMFFFKKMLSPPPQTQKDIPSDFSEPVREKKKKKGSKKKRAAPKPVEIEFVGSDEEPEEVLHPPPSKADGLRVGVTSKQRPGISGLMAKAKQMEEDRKASLGYDEKNLPKSF